MTHVLAAALAWHTAGYSVVRTATDGTKRPLGAWKQYQTQAADEATLRGWFDSGHPGVGVITGTVSGNLEMLELEGRAVAAGLMAELRDLADNSGLGELLDRVLHGYAEFTPTGGFHLFYRVDGPVAGNTKLARRPAPPPTNVEVLYETRGEGGFVVVAPSAGPVHPTGAAWVAIPGADPAKIPTLSEDERDAMHALAIAFDLMPDTTPPEPMAPRDTGDRLRPGDDYNARTSWTELLEPLGWRAVHRHAGVTYWRRPGKNIGISATTGRNDADNLYVFTTSTQFESERPYSKFSAFALLEHGGDHSAAARALRGAGYGDQAPPPATVGDHEDLEVPVVDEFRPRLDVGNAAKMADWLRHAVGRGLLSGMFLRGNDIVHTPQEGEDGYRPLTDATTDSDGPAQVRVIKKSTLASRVQYAFDCFRMVKRDNEWTESPAMFPVDAARVATDVPDELRNLRRLNGVIHTPILRPDGSLLTKPGYDDSTGLLYLPDRNLIVPDVPADPTPSDVRSAVDLLDQMTAGFDFVTEHDRANYYGLLLTPLLRAVTPPPYKLTAISSPQPGSGKTLLATVARIVHGGVFRSELPEDDPELRKQITAMLTVTTGPIIHFDNVTGIIRSSTLAGLLTSATWGDRPLGATEWIGTPNDRLWVVTGNNILVGGDLVRRTLWVSIDPCVPNPERRTGFEIADLERWAAEHRAELLHALLTIARAWFSAGRPTVQSRASDGYSQWTDTITAILANAAVPGTFSHDDSQQQTVSADDDDWGEFLEALYDHFEDRPWTVKELLEKIDTSTRFDPWQGGAGLPIKLHMLPAALAEKAMRPTGLQGIARSLGMWLRNRTGRWAGAHTVRFVREGHARERFWKIEKASDGDNGDSGDTNNHPYAGEESRSNNDVRVRGPELLSPVSSLSPGTAEQATLT